jgi:DNA-binding beta-propeller fold protein YncE
MPASKFGLTVCLLMLLSMVFGCGSEDDPAAPAGSNGTTPDPTRVPQFVTTWGDSCWLGDGRGCVDPDGPGPLVSGDGQFFFPVGVAMDAAGNVYVADTGNDRIQKFDGLGNFLTKWGSAGSGDGEMLNPQGIAVDATGNIYVADGENFRIQKFK